VKSGPRLRQPDLVRQVEDTRERYAPIPHERGGGPWLNTKQAAALVGRETRQAFLKWARRAGLVFVRPKNSRLLMVDKGDVVAAMQRAR
jgi:hypothetical protein